MKKSLIALFFIFTNLLIFASEVIEIPFYYDNEKKSIFVYAEIAGKKGYFLFDTGTFASLIFDKKENYNNFKVVAENYSLIIGGVQDSVSVYSIDDVVLAGNTLKINSYFMVSDNPNMGKDYIGIIGLNVFKDKIFEISMTDSVIRIYDKKPDEYKDFLPIQNYSSVELKIFVPIIIDGKTYNAFVDTGASYGGCILLSPVAHNIKKSKQFKIKTLSGYDSFIVETEAVEVMGIKFKNEDFTTHSIGLSEDIIGMEFLALFDMLFDLRDNENPLFYYKQRIPAEYFNLFIDNHINNRTFYISFDGNNYGFVGKVIENSSAWETGLRPGTVITKINSKPILEYSINDIKAVANETYKITFIDSKGKEKTVKVKPKKML